MKLFQYLLPFTVSVWNCAAQLLRYRSELSGDEILDTRDFDDGSYELFDTRDLLSTLLDLDFERAISRRAAKPTLNVSPAVLKQLSTACKRKKGKRSLPEADVRLQRRAAPRVYEPLFNGRATVVDMGLANIKAFLNGGDQSIGTHSLCGCTAVVISSPKGAIVAHFSPATNRDGQLLAIKQLYQSHRNVLAGATLQLIYPGGLDASMQEAAERLAEYIAEDLRSLGLPTKTSHYSPDEPSSEIKDTRKGTVIVISDENGSVKTYVNGKAV